MAIRENKENNVKNKGMVPAITRLDEARERADKNPKTDKYSFGDSIIDDYCGGGWGRHDAYEMICVFGGTGMNKSTLLSQMIISPALKGDKVAYMALEDEIEDVIIRLDRQLDGRNGIENGERIRKVLSKIDFFPNNTGYSLEKLIEFIEGSFKFYDVVVIDPIQFVFEASVVESGESEWNRQRVFVNKLHDVVVEAKKTLVFVSHTNKSAYNKKSGIDPIGQLQGAGALPQICSKIIQISRDEDGLRYISMPKTRFTKNRYNPLQVSLTPNMNICFDKTGLTAKQIADMEANW